MGHPAVVLDVVRSQGRVGTALDLDPSLAAADAVTCLAEVAEDVATATSFLLNKQTNKASNKPNWNQMGIGIFDS